VDLNDIYFIALVALAGLSGASIAYLAFTPAPAAIQKVWKVRGTLFWGHLTLFGHVGALLFAPAEAVDWHVKALAVAQYSAIYGCLCAFASQILCIVLFFSKEKPFNPMIEFISFPLHPVLWFIEKRKVKRGEIPLTPWTPSGRMA
jgi:hypothetical protein